MQTDTDYPHQTTQSDPDSQTDPHQAWVDPLGLATRPNNGKYYIFFRHKLDSGLRYSSDAVQFNDTNKAFIKKWNLTHHLNGICLIVILN